MQEMRYFMKSNSYLLEYPLVGGMHWIPIPWYAVALTASRDDFGKSFKSNRNKQMNKQSTVLLSLRKVLVLKDHRGPIYKSLCFVLGSQVLVVGPQILENCRGLCILQAVCYVQSQVHKFGSRHHAWGYCEEWLTYWHQILAYIYH